MVGTTLTNAGKPDTTQYILGRGHLYLDLFAEGTFTSIQRLNEQEPIFVLERFVVGVVDNNKGDPYDSVEDSVTMSFRKNDRQFSVVVTDLTFNLFMQFAEI